DALGALAIRRADAVGAGVAAADHDHILASGDERAARRGAFLAVAGDALVLLGQELHRQANAGELGPRDLERARILGTARQHDGVEVLLERLHRHVDADFGGGAESNALSFHLHRAAVDQMLFHLEVGNSVTEQAADAVGLLEHGDGMAGASQLLRAGEAGRSRADDGDSLASLARRDLRLDPAFLPAAVDDRALDRLDGDRLVDDVERASRLARRRADAAGELGEVVRRVQVVERVAPVALVDEVVPVRDLVVHRTAVVTVRDAAVHAAGGLVLQAFLAVRDHELAIVANALARIRIRAVLALDLEEAGFLAHLQLIQSNFRHPRESGDPVDAARPFRALGSRFRGNDDEGKLHSYSAATVAACSRPASSCLRASA